MALTLARYPEPLRRKYTLCRMLLSSVAVNPVPARWNWNR
jgi:hypothetical protein